MLEDSGGFRFDFLFVGNIKVDLVIKNTVDTFNFICTVSFIIKINPLCLEI